MVIDVYVYIKVKIIVFGNNYTAACNCTYKLINTNAMNPTAILQ